MSGRTHVFERPHAALRDSYRGFVHEFVERGEKLVPFVLTFPHEDFDALVAQLDACGRGENLPPGFVPHSTYWLAAAGDVLGVSNLRHRLTPALEIEGGHIGYGVRPSARGRGVATALLGHTLEAARARGIDKVLLTCSQGNVASARTIVRHGGVLVSEEFLPSRGEVVQRYEIAL